MISHPAFEAEPWVVHETHLDPDMIAQTESVFALANGHIGLRGNLDEGEPAGLQGTYLNGFYEFRPLPYAEAGYGNPESGQTVINVTNGKLIRLLVGDEPLDVRYGNLRSHERVLDLRAGLLRRDAVWESPDERAVRIRSTRMVSFTQRAVAAICYEVEALEQPTRVVVQSELVANEPQPDGDGDPRASAVLSDPLHEELRGVGDYGSFHVASTQKSHLTVASAMDHIVEGPDDIEKSIEGYVDISRLLLAADLEAGERLRVVKLIAYGWSSLRSTQALRDQVRGALAEAHHTGWEGLLSEQRSYLDGFWEEADVELEGDPQLQCALRFALFHALQAGARAEGRAIAAKGLTGPGYDGHAFWDSEAFVLPVLTYTAPHAVRDALSWRHATLDLARERARQLDLQGAAFPWRTINGEECSGYWPAGTAAFHIGAAVADATVRYYAATEDDDFARGVGLELLVETARLWRSLGHHDTAGRFRIDGVTGPDEYSAIADNNVYTNLMAERNLREAFNRVQAHPQEAAALGVNDEEAASWRDAAAAMMVPYDPEREVHPQAEDFTEHDLWDFADTAPDQYPLLLHFPYFDLYRKQVIKQADLVLALHLRGDFFSDEDKTRDFAYTEALTVRDSSLSACTQAVIAAEVGHMDLAYEYFCEAALIDLDDLQHNTRDGMHIASLAGTWIAAVAGFGGMRDHDGKLSFKPRLAPEIGRLCFRMCYRGRRLKVDVSHESATYSLMSGPALEIVHHGKPVKVPAKGVLKRSIPPAPHPEPVQQPAGRAPARPPGTPPRRGRRAAHARTPK